MRWILHILAGNGYRYCMDNLIWLTANMLSLLLYIWHVVEQLFSFQFDQISRDIQKYVIRK